MSRGGSTAAICSRALRGSRTAQPQIQMMLATGVVSLLLSGLASDAVRIIQPQEDEGVPFIPDVPLWVHLDLKLGECASLILDGEFQLHTCESDTFLDGDVEDVTRCHLCRSPPCMCRSTFPRAILPGVHTITALAGEEEDSVTFNVSFDHHSAIPDQFQTEDRAHIFTPVEAESYHYWYHNPG